MLYILPIDGRNLETPHYEQGYYQKIRVGRIKVDIMSESQSKCQHENVCTYIRLVFCLDSVWESWQGWTLISDISDISKSIVACPLTVILLAKAIATMTTIPENGDANGTTDLQVRLKYSKSEKDDWTKVEDKALRKRIQDRLAKRKSRMFRRTAFCFPPSL